MCSYSNKYEFNESSGENVTSINVSDDFVKLIKNEIIEILQLNEDEMRSAITEDLLKNGRQAIMKYKDDIIPKVYSKVMNGNHSSLLNTLKKYFRHKWEVEYASSESWFISFLKQYENEENHDIYENVLIRTAQYGNKYLKDCPLLSIVLQLFFECIDDNSLEETDHIFDDLWMTITNDGLQSITKFSEYILGKVLNEQLKKESVLFKALREYYRSNVFLSLTQSAIPKRKKLYDLALDDVVEHGWLSDLKSIESDIVPKRYQALLENLRSFYKTQKPSQNEDFNGSVVSSSSTTRDITNSNQQAADEANQFETNELEKTDSMQNIISMNETPINANVVMDVLDHVTDGNIETIYIEKDKQEQEDNESDISYDSKSDLSDTNGMLVYSKDAIYISGLPTIMIKKRLFDTLRNVFTTCGDIKINKETNKPDIWLFSQQQNKSQLSGAAIVKFQKEESVMIAIEKYNRQQVPALNNARISVRVNRMKPNRIEKRPIPILISEPRRKTQEYSGEQQSTIHTADRRQLKRDDESIGSNSSKNSAGVCRISDTMNTPTFSNDSIYITGLPTNMLEQRLFDILWDEFSTVGSIKIDKEVKKPCICLFKLKDFSSKLNGNAMLTFENEESITKAIEKYNGKQVSSLNDNRLCVQRYRLKSVRSLHSPQSNSQSLIQASSIPLSRPESQPDGPVSIFWDIENVAIPAGNNAFEVLLKLRTRLIEDRKLHEGTFKTYYRNINNVSQQHRTDLHYANVLAQHIESTKYGAVDIQIHKDLQRFIEQHKTPATVVLISGDIDFIKDLNELRFRHRHYTIVIHNPQAKEQLLRTANEFISWNEFVERKWTNEPKQQYTSRSSKNSPRDVKQHQMSCNPKSPNLLGTDLNQTYSLEKTRTSTPPLTKSTVDKSAVDTNNCVLESTSTAVDQSNRYETNQYLKKCDVLKNELRMQKKLNKNENKQNAQPLKQLMSSTSDANSVTASTNKIKNPKKKVFACSMCDKNFPSVDGRSQHEQDKHKVGTLVEVSSLTHTDGSHNHSQSSDYGNQSNMDLIAFTNDDDDVDLSQPNLLMTTMETSLLVEFSDDDSNTSESLSALNDSLLLSTNSSNNKEN